MTMTQTTQKQYRSICFTSFNLDIDWFKDWTKQNKSIISYIIIQGELTKDGNKHIQGYCQFTGQKRMEQIKKFFGDPALHIEATMGTPDQAANYCKQIKNGTFHNFEEYGEMIVKEQGKRNDLIAIRQKIIDGETIRQIQKNTDNNNELQLTLKYYKQLKELEDSIRYENFKEAVKSEFENIQWRPFQQVILNELDNIADKRKVKWIYDNKGNSGKSYLARYLLATKDIYYITGGKQADILYSYDNQPIIIYDLARTYADNLEHIYTTIENFKNGQYLSTKYESKQRFFKIPHIIVMANFTPDLSKLSKDRWDVINIDLDDYDINNNIVNCCDALAEVAIDDDIKVNKDTNNMIINSNEELEINDDITVNKHKTNLKKIKTMNKIYNDNDSNDGDSENETIEQYTMKLRKLITDNKNNIPF